ncbi:MAG TPA: hypothetical protein VLM84_03870, partial [Chromatiaceae bacterium]|nr:hypothetical protein [Chromatiaceae bacterium]
MSRPSKTQGIHASRAAGTPDDWAPGSAWIWVPVQQAKASRTNGNKDVQRGWDDMVAVDMGADDMDELGRQGCSQCSGGSLRRMGDGSGPRVSEQALKMNPAIP